MQARWRLGIIFVGRFGLSHILDVLWCACAGRADAADGLGLVLRGVSLAWKSRGATLVTLAGLADDWHQFIGKACWQPCLGGIDFLSHRRREPQLNGCASTNSCRPLFPTGFNGFHRGACPPKIHRLFSSPDLSQDHRTRIEYRSVTTTASISEETPFISTAEDQGRPAPRVDFDNPCPALQIYISVQLKRAHQ